MNNRNYSYLLNTRRILLWGEINEKTSYNCVAKLKYLADKNKDPIYIYIHSDGGDVECADAIVDEIQGCIARGIEVCTIGMGKAFSSACMILVMGSPGRRYAIENCAIMIHTILYSLPLNYVQQQQRQTDFIHKKSELFLKRFCKACGKGVSGKKFEEFKQQIVKELWLTPKEAIKHGIIDEIWNYSWEELISEKYNQRRNDNGSKESRVSKASK